tara:strand:+ start:370 stop:1230 length:861 start_codon:yes stop_codon:yes gene_type:complete
MSCSTDVGLQALKALENNVKSQLAGLAAGTGGLTNNLSTLQSKINLAKDVSTALTAALPSLDGLIPSATLIGEMGSLIAAKNNPAQFAAQLLSISQRYVDVPGVDVNALATSVLNGSISADNICSQIPNVIIDKAGNVLKKGIPPLPPTKNVEDLISTAKKAAAEAEKKLPMIAKIANEEIKEKVEAFSALKAPENLGVAKDLTSKLPTKGLQNIAIELKTATAKMGNFTQKQPVSFSADMASSVAEAKKTIEDIEKSLPKEDLFVMEQTLGAFFSDPTGENQAEV